tara:strand:+ start:78 stop:323 length:246 start_codon:yes stop_codon:yes gene_type:complete
MIDENYNSYICDFSHTKEYNQKVFDNRLRKIAHDVRERFTTKDSPFSDKFLKIISQLSKKKIDVDKTINLLEEINPKIETT